MKLATIAIACALICCARAAGGQWTENSFTSFRNGSFLDAGSNLYVSAAGRVQMINRWDFNGDGHLDIFIPSGHAHTEKEDTFVYFNSGQDIDGRSLMKLPANGSRDGVIRDFNKDGLNDLAVCNGDNGITTRTDAYVYYGSKQGLTVEKRLTLPAHNSSSIAAGDFNGDGWIDLAIACQWRDGDINAPAGPTQSFVYWNGPDGFREGNRAPLSFGGAGATVVAAGDLDTDGQAELIVMTGKTTYVAYGKDRGIEDASKRIELPLPAVAAAVGDVDGDKLEDLALCVVNEGVFIFRGSPGGLIKDAPIRLQANWPRDVALADFDGDGLDDVAVANYATREGAPWVNSFVYFSDGKDFKARPRCELPTMGAAGVSAGDLNSDGKPEIVFSNEGVLNQRNIASCVYWNAAGTFSLHNRTELDTQGSVANAIGDVNNDGKPDIVFLNFEGNFRDGPSTSQIYWGDGSRNFSRLRCTEMPTHYITSIAHADLNDDGHVDLVLTQSRFLTGTPDALFNSVLVYWGSDAGLATCTRLAVESLAGGVRVADLNRDGWLDLVVGALSSDPKETKRKGIPIFWGSRAGYSHHHRSIVAPVPDYPRVPLIADVNRDGFPDLVNQSTFGSFMIWWGSAGDIASAKTTTIDLGRKDQLVFIDAADLNKDGWLDLILPCRKVGSDSEVSSFMYYGSPSGFSNAHREELPSKGIYEVSAADLDRDSWLDLVFTSYQGNFKRNFPSLVYWGSSEGFKKRQPTELPTYAASGIETADYDNDGWIDLLFSNHRIDGSTDKPGPHNHRTDSMLYWGGQDGFSVQRRLDLPANGPHAMNVRDVGNGIDRALHEDFVSSPFELPEGQNPISIEWTAKTPHGTKVELQLRRATTVEGLKDAPWSGPREGESWYDTSGAKVSLTAPGRWIQYRARLSTPNGGPTPYLTSMTINFQ